MPTPNRRGPAKQEGRRRTAIWADLLPVQGYVSITVGFWPFLSNLILPR